MLGIAAFYIVLLVKPAITLVNSSGFELIQTSVKLPSNRLNFGVLGNEHNNTLYYDLAQPKDGVYQYHFVLEEGRVLQGECGYVTNNEVHKRLMITVHRSFVTCVR